VLGRNEANYRAWREKNKEKLAAKARRQRAKDIKRSRVIVASYRERNLEKERERRRSYMASVRAADPITNRQKQNEWFKSNRDRARTYEAKQRAVRKGAEGTYTADDVQIILEAQNNLCFYCEVPLSKWHEDHFIPLSKGGTNYRCNIVLTCAKCNLSKGSKAPVEFLNWQMKLPTFWHEGETKMGTRQYEPATVFNARIVDLRHLWVPSDTYQGQKTQKPNFFASFIVRKTVPQWHMEPALAGIAQACGNLYQKNPHILSWPVQDGDMPSPSGKSSEHIKGHWLFSGSSGNPPSVELAQPNGTLVKLANRVGVKPGDVVMAGVTAAVKQNDPRGVKLYLNAVVFCAPGEEIVFANSVSGAELMAQAQKQGLQIAGFSGSPGFGSGGFVPQPGPFGGAPQLGFTPPSPPAAGPAAFPPSSPVPGGFQPPPAFAPQGGAPAWPQR
jgi:5-methylcytosine-specific restriction endonuclease McrA